MRVRIRAGGGERRPKRVVKTGPALVHEGETVYPAAGSAAQAIAAADDAQAAVQVVFPVEIEVSSGGATGEAEAATDLAMRRAALRLSRLA